MRFSSKDCSENVSFTKWIVLNVIFSSKYRGKKRKLCQRIAKKCDFCQMIEKNYSNFVKKLCNICEFWGKIVKNMRISSKERRKNKNFVK